MTVTLKHSKQYQEFFAEIKERIKRSQYDALKAVNKELIQLYWSIGESIAQKQEKLGWGQSVVELLARELQLEFSGIQGFSAASLWRMRNFYTIYRNNKKLAPLVREISWSHNIAIFEKCKDDLEREYYLQMAKNCGWSRQTLITSIKNQSYERFLLNQTNFKKTLPEKQYQQAKLAVRDEYSFDFLELNEEHSEKELEVGLVNNVRKFLTEIGNHFTFVGSQYPLEIDAEQYFIDLLLYHRKLRSLVAIELKKDKFKPEYAGKMQFYLSALDDTVKLDDENPSIGIIICQEKKRTTVEYTLKDVNKPMGVSTYRTKASLPPNMRTLLPSPEIITEHLKVFEDSTSPKTKSHS